MRFYENCMELASEITRDLAEMGVLYRSATVQDKKVSGDEALTKEITGYAYTLLAWPDRYDLLKYFGVDRDWVADESFERLQQYNYPRNPGKAWMLRRKFWEPFLRDGIFAYTYAERWHSQIERVVYELQIRPMTRQAVMTMYSTERDMLNWGGRDRVPCSLTYQFLLREDRLDLIYNQRSCDLKKFFASDVFCTIDLLEHVAKRVDAQPGKFIHFLGSLHAFKKDLEGVF